MSLPISIAIPVHDDEAPLIRLLARLAALRLEVPVIVVDDGSATPLDASRLCTAAGWPADRLTLLRQPLARGAGAARNQALEKVETDYFLYLDADDLPTRELVGLLADLDGERFDFCLFQHHDSRMDRDRLWGQMPFDQAHWAAAGLDCGALAELATDAAVQLVQTANYPWNKVYRTGFLRDHGIGCSEITVHEDIELHWRSFLNAGRALVSDRVGVVHFVAEDGTRLTNRTGAERLAVFAPLETVFSEIETRGATRFVRPFLRFSLGLMAWIGGNLRPDLQAQFTTRARSFLARRMTAAELAAIAAEDPGLIARAEGLIGSDQD